MPFNPSVPYPAEEPARPRYTPPRVKGLHARVLAIASQTSDPIARADLQALAPDVRRIERALDELVAEALAEALQPGEVLQ